MVIQAIGNIFENGAPSYISRCLSARRKKEVHKTSVVSVYVSVGVTLVMTLLCMLFMEPVLHILEESRDTAEPARAYLNVIASFSFVVTLQIILPALLRSEGMVKQAVIGMLNGTVLNIVLDPVFILLLHLGTAGAAWMEIIGDFFAVFYYIGIFLNGKTALSIMPVISVLVQEFFGKC